MKSTHLRCSAEHCCNLLPALLRYPLGRISRSWQQPHSRLLRFVALALLPRLKLLLCRRRSHGQRAACIGMVRTRHSRE